MPTTVIESVVLTSTDLVSSYLTAASTYVAKHGVRLSLLKKGRIVHSIEIVTLCDMEYATAKSNGMVLSFDYYFIGNQMQRFTLDKFLFYSKQNTFTIARFVHTFVCAINALLPLLNVPLPDLTPKEIPKAVEKPAMKKKRKRKQAGGEMDDNYFVCYENTEAGVRGFLKDFTAFNVEGIVLIRKPDSAGPGVSGEWRVELKTGTTLHIELAGYKHNYNGTLSLGRENEVYQHKDGQFVKQILKPRPKKLSKYGELKPLKSELL
jgi:hypothetical protein